MNNQQSAPVTLTADVLVLCPGKRLLLIQRAKWPYAGYWALPGGKVHEGESVELGAIRELREETGIEVQTRDLQLLTVQSTPGRDPRGRYISVVFLAHVPLGTCAVAADDALCAGWFRADELPELAFDHDQVVRMLLRRKVWQ